MPAISATLIALLALLLPVVSTAQGTCPTPVPKQFNDEGGPHAEQCAELLFSHYPPTSGRHYSKWAAFRTYEFILNAGNWLHSAEHGAVVFLVNCRLPGDCRADFAKLKALADGLPVDPLCDTATKRRVIISGDSLITTRFAAVAWNWSMQSDCLDTAAFAGFYRNHYAKAPEDFCFPGEAFPEQGGCNGPLPLRHSESGREVGPGLLWAGNLTGRGRLTAELVDLEGRRMRLIDLGVAGPGPARVEKDGRFGGPGGAVVVRFRFDSGAGPGILGEAVLRP